MQLLTFLLQDEGRLERLVALTGITKGDLQSRMQEPQFLAFVMDYALQDQSLVMEFAGAANLPPEAVVAARRKLPGAEF